MRESCYYGRFLELMNGGGSPIRYSTVLFSQTLNCFQLSTRNLVEMSYTEQYSQLCGKSYKALL